MSSNTPTTLGSTPPETQARHRRSSDQGSLRPFRDFARNGWPLRGSAGFTVAELTAKVHALTGEPEQAYTTRQAAYDLRKLRAKQLVVKPGRTRRYHVPVKAARTIVGLQTLRDYVIAPVLAGVRRPGPGRPPKTWTRIDRDYETLRSGLRTLLEDLGVSTETAAAA